MGEVEYEWDEAKRNWNLKERDLDFADAHLIYESETKVTLPSSRNHEDQWQDIDIVELMGLTLVLGYTKRKSKVRVISMRQASRKERQLYADERSKQ